MTQAPNGIYISEATAEGTRQMFIDHEMIEFAAINAKVRRRLNRQEKEAADQRTAAIKAARKAHCRSHRSLCPAVDRCRCRPCKSYPRCYRICSLLWQPVLPGRQK